jgi:signal transduction histidine kinase
VRPEDRQGRLTVVRAVAFVGVLAYALSWIANQRVPGFRDPLVLRAAIGGLILAAGLATWVSPWVVARISPIVRALVYLVTLHDFLLLVLNDLHPLQVVGTYLVLSAVVAASPLFVTEKRQLVTYLVAVALLAVGAAIVVERPLSARPQFLIGIGTFAALAWLALRSHLRALAELRESETQARAVLQAVPDVLLRLGPDDVVKAVLGEPHGALAGRAAALVGRPLGELHRDGRVVAGDDAIDVEIRIVAVGDGDRLALVRDVTKEKQLESQVRMTDRLAAMGTLATGVAHEINNPLAYVLANLQYVSRQLEKDPEAIERGSESLQALSDAAEGAERVKQIVASMKQYAGAEGADLATDVESCVSAALKAIDAPLRERARIELDLQPMPLVLADPIRLTQVLVNLITNALQAVPGEGRSAGMVTVRSRGGDDRVVVEVIDDGMGIPASTLDRIFDPFYTTKAPGGGMGLGLWVCHQLVNTFGGRLDASSREGEGTTMRVTLSVAKRTRTGPPPADETAAEEPDVKTRSS